VDAINGEFMSKPDKTKIKDQRLSPQACHRQARWRLDIFGSFCIKTKRTQFVDEGDSAFHQNTYTQNIRFNMEEKTV
jgi:hypothetical protein